MKTPHLVLVCLLVTIVALFGGVVAAQDDTVTVTVWMHGHEPRVALDEERIPAIHGTKPEHYRRLSGDP